MAGLMLAVSLFLFASRGLGETLPIEAKGSKFFDTNGTQFFIKGIAYQQEAAAGTGGRKTKYLDPLADVSSCQRDVPFLRELGINTIRTYHIDPTADHDECMQLLQDSGIYVISDLGEPDMSINREDPRWDVTLFARYRKVVDSLAKYPNVIGFFAGNEVSDSANTSAASVYVKAAVRDMKRYVRENKKMTRWLGFGYAANDASVIRDDIVDYFACGPAEERVDFWGYNVYSWCGDSDMKRSHFAERAEYFRDYEVPVFFAEYGCNEVKGGGTEREFKETAALYSAEMSSVFSGGIVYMYFEEANNYGLVQFSKGQATIFNAFHALKAQLAKARPEPISRDAYLPRTRPRSCPPVSTTWLSHPSLPPTPNSALCKCMYSSRTCIPASSLSAVSYSEIFNYVCGALASACTTIASHPDKGVHGAYTMCDDTAKLAAVLDAYYKEHETPSACRFDGKAKTQRPHEDKACAETVDDAPGESVGSDQDSAARGFDARAVGQVLVMVVVAVVVAF
ncbi:hypothetical protein CDD82_2828 [Ophiocordyceps australis]|uniref:1,3-beta-glucanosyltransferase n=1 Tax=Ophiocordyceps australis TaxID=1399860 RepID=A0A2C5ZHY4_9HYPO|nr:hypothetical protein CDD82_2828 [Ophiocordyceps australis]